MILSGLRIVIFVILGVLSGYDIKYKEVPVWLVCVGMITGIIHRLVQCYNGAYLMEMVWAITPGVFLILTGVVSKQVGIGDGLILTMSELCIRPHIVLNQLLFLAVGSVIVALLYIIRKQSDSRIPYVPVIFCSHIFVLIWERFI